MFHIELEPADTNSARWQAGDIAEILAPVVPEGARSNGVAAAASDAHTLDVRREFSIASLPEDGRIHLVVRQVRRSDGSLGVGSGWLTDIATPGVFVKLRVRSNPSFHAPALDAPVIFIGNGSGIAGLRSHLKARALAKASHAWLIFGERSSAHDALYREEIDAWRSTGVLERVDYAFSRDQAERRYVQHVLREHGATVREWAGRGAAILVCGSMEGMAPGVDAALREILGDGELNRLAAEGRYRRDVY
jgi:sulfite reductase (NADPH) flavoprotein alpha-component